MEYTQWAAGVVGTATCQSLNPCCNGIYSMRKTYYMDSNIIKS